MGFGQQQGNAGSSAFSSLLTGVAIAVAIMLLAAPAQALNITTKAREAILMDAETGTVLYEHAADELMPPASMSKLMTLLMVFDRLANGSLSMDDTFPVSEKAWRKGGSKMFVMVGAEISIADLLRGIVIQSGNDACIVIAEGIAGDEETFAAMMTERGREIGLTNSTFRNATGWPDPEHQMTARDLATLARFMVRNYPDYYALFAETEFTWQGIRQPNRNPLLGSYRGADGLKTGHTESAGYGLVASAERDGRRLISVVNGLGSDRERAAESRRLLNIGFQEFDNYTLLSAGQTVDEADVWLGDRDHIPLVVADQLRLTLPRDVRQGLEAKLHYQNPVPAPVEKGAQIGTLRLTAPEMAPIEIPVLAGESAGKLGFFGRISAAFNYLLWGASSG